LRHARAGLRDRADIAQSERITRRDHDALLALRERDHNCVVESRRVGNGDDVGTSVVVLEGMQVDRRDHHLAPGQSPQSFLAPFRQACEAAAALAQCPLQQRIVAAADDRRRGHVRECRRRHQAGHHPAVEGRARK